MVQKLHILHLRVYKPCADSVTYHEPTMAAITNLVKAGAAAERLGVSIRVLRSWDQKCLIDTVRTPGGMRLFDVEGYLAKQTAATAQKQRSALISGPVHTSLAIERAVDDQLEETDQWQKDVEDVFHVVHEKAIKDDCKFPICFENATKWIGFTRKDHAKTHLLNNFNEHVDFEFSRSRGETRSDNATTVGRPVEAIYLTADCFKTMCMTANTPQGKRVRKFYLDLERRLREGDLTLAGQVVTNYDIAHGSTTTVLLNTAQKTASQPPAWVPLWKQARGEQKDKGIILRDILKEMNIAAPVVYATVEHLHNQGVLGFSGTTRQWKKDNGIQDAKPVAECMDHMQLAVREQFSEKLAQVLATIENPNPVSIKEAAYAIKEKISEHSAWLGLQEYRPETDDNGGKVPVGKRVRQLEAAVKRSTKRLATLERKQQLMHCK
jgi:DNA-binding transcriptional MerR regulator/phage anti-repressor protein